MDELIQFHLYHYLMIRVKKDFNPFEAFCERFPQVVVSKEMSLDDTPHYHCLVAIPKDDVIDPAKYLKMHALYMNSLGLYKNPQFSSKFVTTINDATRYTLKEGEYQSKGFHEPTLKLLQKTSYIKFDKKKFAKDLSDLEIRYAQGHLTDQGFFEGYVQVRLKYGQNYPSSQQLNYVKRIWCLHNPNYLSDMNKYVYRSIRPGYDWD